MTTYRNFRHLQADEDLATYYNDFHLYTAGDWTITTTELGAGSATEAISSTDAGGVLVLTNDAADNDNDFLQLVNETFKFTVGKKLMFKARFKVLEVLQADVVIGLQITDTAPLAVSDGIFIRKDDGDALLDFVVCKNGTESVLAGFASLTANTYCTVEFYYDGSSDDIDVSFNGVRAGSLPLTNAPDDENLTISFGIQNGEAVANVMSIDYIRAQMQR